MTDEHLLSSGFILLDPRRNKGSRRTNYAPDASTFEQYWQLGTLDSLAKVVQTREWANVKLV